MSKKYLNEEKVPLFSKFTKKNCFIFIFLLFIILSLIIAFIPYNPENDLADATTNDIWIDYYRQGIYHIPYDEWDYPPTQSVVVEYEGDFVVVNEKGPGHVMLLLPFNILGIEFLFGPLMVFVAVFSTYMIGNRLCNWYIGFFAAVLVLCNSMVLIMWNQYYWTDASTMHLLIFSIWLIVEAIYWFNGKTINPKKEDDSNFKYMPLGIILCFLSGLIFGLSISTRYPTGLMIVAIIAFIFVYYLYKIWSDIRNKNIFVAFKKALPIWIFFGVLILGLLVALVPLMNYNSEYFGDPFGSGYDGTLLLDGDSENNDPYYGTGGPSEVGLNPRNISTSWSGSILGFEKISKIISNFFLLIPIFFMRMPYIVFVPFGLWFFRKRPAVVLLFLLVLINLSTYLSLSTVELYAQHPDAVWEPRYFMPAVPAIALLGSIGMYALAKGIITSKHRFFSSKTIEKRKNTAKKLVVVSICIIIIISMISAGLYFILFRGAIPDPRQGPPDGMDPFRSPRPKFEIGIYNNWLSQNELYKIDFKGFG